MVAVHLFDVESKKNGTHAVSPHPAAASRSYPVLLDAEPHVASYDILVPEGDVGNLSMLMDKDDDDDLDAHVHHLTAFPLTPESSIKSSPDRFSPTDDETLDAKWSPVYLENREEAIDMSLDYFDMTPHTLLSDDGQSGTPTPTAPRTPTTSMYDALEASGPPAATLTPISPVLHDPATAPVPITPAATATSATTPVAMAPGMAKPQYNSSQLPDVHPLLPSAPHLLFQGFGDQALVPTGATASAATGTKSKTLTSKTLTSKTLTSKTLTSAVATQVKQEPMEEVIRNPSVTTGAMTTAAIPPSSVLPPPVVKTEIKAEPPMCVAPSPLAADATGVPGQGLLPGALKRTAEVAGAGAGDVDGNGLTKRQRRLIKNRESASNSRLKRKEYLQTLESQISVLHDQNTSLKDQLAKSRHECEKLREENQRLMSTGHGNAEAFEENKAPISAKAAVGGATSLLTLMFVMFVNFQASFDVNVTSPPLALLGDDGSGRELYELDPIDSDGIVTTVVPNYDHVGIPIVTTPKKWMRDEEDAALHSALTPFVSSRNPASNPMSAFSGVDLKDDISYLYCSAATVRLALTPGAQKLSLLFDNSQLLREENIPDDTTRSEEECLYQVDCDVNDISTVIRNRTVDEAPSFRSRKRNIHPRRLHKHTQQKQTNNRLPTQAVTMSTQR